MLQGQKELTNELNDNTLVQLNYNCFGTNSYMKDILLE